MSIRENLNHILQNIEKAARKWDRASQEIHLVAVSKTQPPEKIREALDAGHRLFGENRVQEAITHWKDIKPLYPDLKLHLIGPLQTNKVKEAVSLFDMIETVDREKLARALAAEMQKQERSIPCLIQVNTGHEEQKAGIPPEALPAFLKLCRKDCRLDIRGLMCIPPVDEPAALHFALLKKLVAENNLKDLSMGMSADYEKAIPLGATYIRVGTALFGPRL
ncbi:MAG: YggS family pyridoxal phosphate-dependent enzyme [Alphaproteobacteria bacterium]|nr:YggS family pyridoxal phosphate-dependent enzyme [Alphaproteobacteria bacterium]MBP7758689.1 YggS family pyridoxal phosphate-dependent enzyme [Alphaproteobacteria bacterium]MBP7761717.1 YggS family pyridoxal phosphate-dependent enzyme [Alphaproteobacteria bacterium]MBP7903948.1 YggS family pyridoxal phosphate-dependent enzyme [Alphaproteobacteria bacterium]